MLPRSLSRRDQYDIFDSRRNVDDFFTRMFSNPFWERWSSTGSPIAWIPPLDCFIDKDRYHIRLALPGVKPNEVNLQVHGNELSISGERKQEIVPSEDHSFQREITYGSFERIVPLPEGIQSDKIEANFNQGVLEISAPLSERALPHRIEIKGVQAGTGGKKLAA
ncbi:MAG: Hsp20/alpha crystallin family protein [Terriglobales bacterium]